MLRPTRRPRTSTRLVPAAIEVCEVRALLSAAPAAGLATIHARPQIEFAPAAPAAPHAVAGFFGVGPRRLDLFPVGPAGGLCLTAAAWGLSGAWGRGRNLGVSRGVVPKPAPTPTPPPISALTPALVRAAYSVNAIRATGAGATIAIVDAYHDPNLVADLNAFDKAFMTTAGGSTSLYSAYGDASRFLTVVSQSGGKNDLPKADKLWASEIALDVESAHAIAPGAKVLLVEARSSALADLLAADARAVAMGANVVSNSWGSEEFAAEASYDTTFAAKGVTFVFAAGDGGRQSYPATSPRVLSVGGTTLLVAGGRWTGETAWSGGGGGVSTIEGKPAYQNSAVAGAFRSGPDVSYDADPNTGFAIYDTYQSPGWVQTGGTSAGAPQWAALVALADGTRAAAGRSALDGFSQALPALYKLAAARSGVTAYQDITSGGNKVAAAGHGYDAATGLGTPRRADLIYAALVSA